MRRLRRLLVMTLAGTGCVAAGSEELPFELGAGVILVQAGINGPERQPFIFDTGATESLLTPQAAAKAGLGKADGKRVTCDVSLGSKTTTGAPFLVHDPLQAISLRLDNGIDYAGILGYPFLSKFDFTINYDRKVIDWETAGTTGQARKMEPGATRVPFVLRDRLIHIPVMVNGKGPLTFLLDTGSAEVLLLPRAAEVLGIRALSAKRTDGIRFAAVERISVGKATVSNVSVVVHRLQREGIGALTYEGILGYPFLSHFKTTISYKDQALVLEPLDTKTGRR